jgi:hypothetical protein
MGALQAEDDESAEERAAEEDIEPEEEDVRPSKLAKPATKKDTQPKPARAKVRRSVLYPYGLTYRTARAACLGFETQESRQVLEGRLF